MECVRQQDDPYFEVSYFLEDAWRAVSEANEELQHYMTFIIQSTNNDMHYHTLSDHGLLKNKQYPKDSMLRSKNVCVSGLMTHLMPSNNEDEGTICWNKGINTVAKIPRITGMIGKTKFNDESLNVSENNVFDETHETKQQVKYCTSKENVKLSNNTTFRSAPVGTTDQLLSWVDNLVKEVNSLNVDENENIKLKNPSALSLNVTKKNDFTSKGCTINKPQINREDQINGLGKLKLMTTGNNSYPRSSQYAKESKCLDTQYRYSSSDYSCSDSLLLKSTDDSEHLYTFDELYTNDKKISKYNQSREEEIQSEFRAQTLTAITNVLQTTYPQVSAPHTVNKEILGPSHSMTFANHPKKSREYSSPSNRDAARGLESKCIKEVFDEVKQFRGETDKLISVSSEKSRIKMPKYCKQLHYTQSGNYKPEYTPEIQKHSLQTTYPVCYSQDTKSFTNQQIDLSNFNEQCMKDSLHMNAVKYQCETERLDVGNNKSALSGKPDNVDKTGGCLFHENLLTYWDDSLSSCRGYKARTYISENHLTDRGAKNNEREKEVFIPQNQIVGNSFSYEIISEPEQMRNRTSENSMRNQTLNESVDETELSFLTNSLNLLRKENIEMGCTSCKHKQHQSVNDSCALSASQVHKTSNELTLPDVSAPYNNGFKSEISQTGLKASFRNPTLFEKTFGEEISKQSESKIVTDFATFPRTRKTAAVNGDIIHKSVIHNEQNELSQILFPDETLEQQINSATFPRSSKSKNLSRQEIIKFMTMIASSTYKPPPERQHLELKPDHSVENHSIQQQSSEIERMSKDSATQTDSWPSKCSVLNSLSWPKLLDCVSEDTEGNLSGEEMDLLLLRSSFKDTVLSSTPSLASISRDDNLKDEQINFYIQMKSCHSSKNSSLGLSECSAVFSLDDNCCDSQQQHPSFENDNRELLALESQSTETTQENCQKQLQIDSGKKLLQWKWNITKRPKSQSWPCLSLNRSESANTKRCYSENSVVIKNFYSIQVEGKVDVMSIFGKQPLQKMNFKSLSDSMLEKKDTIKNHETLVCCPQLARNTLAEEAFDVIYPSSQTKKERPGNTLYFSRKNFKLKKTICCRR